MKFRTAIAAVVVALLAVLLGPVSPAQAAKPRLTLLFTSAESGIVAGNAIWGQKSIQWTGYVAGRPKGSRLVTQTKLGGAWRTITTTDKSVRRTVARGSFFPLLGEHRYRIALLSAKGRLLVASVAWPSTGFATVPLSRVVTALPPSIGAITRTIGGYAYPMLGRFDPGAAPAAPAGPYVVDAGRCRSVRMATSLTYGGPPSTSAAAWLSVTWSPKPSTVVLGDSAAAAVAAGGSSATATRTLSSVADKAGSPGAYSFSPRAIAYQGSAASPVAWAGGEVLFGGVGLCSRVVR